jgi:hypothetical protein
MSDSGNRSTHSKPVMDALALSDSMTAWIAAHHPEELAYSESGYLAAKHFAICLDHRASMALLLQHGQRSSANALLRPLYEALLRGLWAKYCADSSALKEVAKRRALPKLETIVRQLDRVKVLGGTFGANKARFWEPMSEFVHGGTLQLARWSDADGIAPNHPDSEVIQLLKTIDLFGALACYNMATLSPNDSPEYVRKTRDLTNSFEFQLKVALGTLE